MGEGFRAERIDIWLHVETNENAHQIKQGLYAIATGGVFGKGLGNSMQKLGYIPEAYNDMIFAVVCEELGIVEAAGLIIAFLVMFWRITWIAIKATDLFGTMICVGVLIQLAIQVVINVAVVTNSISVDRDSIAVDQLWWNFCDDHDGGNGTGVVGVSRK